MNQDAKRLIYFAHIHSHLTYANTVWSAHISRKQKKYRKNPKILSEINSKETTLHSHRPTIQITKNNEI